MGYGGTPDYVNGGVAPPRQPRPGDPDYHPTLPPAANQANTTFTGSDPMGNFNLPGWSDRNAYAENQMVTAGGRAAPQSANDSQFRGYQDSLAQRLSRQVNGEDSLSQYALRNSTNQNLAQQRSMAASASPGNVAMAQRLAQQGAGSINQGYGAQAAQLGIQERNAAANALTGLSSQARGQDLQNNQFNAGAQLANRGQNDQYSLGQGQLALANAAGQQRGSMGYEANQTQRYGIDKNAPKEPAWWEKALGYGAQLAPLAFLADGGVATEPTNAVVGEAGPEAILPLGDLIGAAQKRATPGALQPLSALSQQPVDHHERRMQYLSSMAQSNANSSDPIARGIGAGMGAYSAIKGHQKSTTPAIQSGLSQQTQDRPQLGGVDQGYDMIRPPTLMAQGGIVTKPTNTIIGEQGPEAVVPLGKLPGLIDRLQQSVAQPTAVAGDVYAHSREPMRADRVQERVPTRSPVSLVSHERDVMAEDPFVLEARAREAEERARDARSLVPRMMTR